MFDHQNHPPYPGNTIGLRWRWFIVSVLAFAFMLTHASDGSVFFGRYSLSYGLMLVVMLALALGAGLLCAPPVWKRLGQWARRLPAAPVTAGIIGVVGIAGLGLLWRFLPGARFHAPIALFTVYLTGVLAAALLWLMARLGAGEKYLAPRAARWGGVALIGAIMLMVALHVGRVPASLVNDEGWITNWGYTMWTTGEPAASVLPTKERAHVALQPLFYPLEGAWLTVTGISFAAARWYWLLLAWLGAPFMALAARHLYGSYAAWAAGALALLIPLGHNYIRPDAWVGTSLAIGLWAYITARKTGSFWRYLLAGVALALTIEGSSLSMRYPLFIGLFLTLAYIRRIIQTRRWYWDAAFWGVALGGAAYTGLFFILHTLPWGVTLAELPKAAQEGYAAEYLLGSSEGTGLTRLINITVRWLREYVARHPLDAGLSALALGFAFWRRTHANLALGGLWVLTMALFFVLLPKYSIYYFAHHLPVFVLLTGGLLAYAFATTENRISWLQAAALVLLVVLYTAQTLREAAAAQHADSMIAVGYAIDADLPPEVTDVWGWQAYYYGLHARNLIISEEFLHDTTLAWMDEYDIPPPQAIIITRGLDDLKPNIFDYIAARGMVIGGCYTIDIYGRSVVLYVLPEFAPSDAPKEC